MFQQNLGNSTYEPLKFNNSHRLDIFDKTYPLKGKSLEAINRFRVMRHYEVRDLYLGLSNLPPTR
ncbi:hypothetical protein HUJ04_005028 [Dendroctonus ponderosae]|nr:hypothetical protein HUJ04_005028 [Dendroctonus ponderosae]